MQVYFLAKKETASKAQKKAFQCGFWRREGDSNPWYGGNRTHDFQSCSFGQLGHLSKQQSVLYQNKSKKSSLFEKLCCAGRCNKRLL